MLMAYVTCMISIKQNNNFGNFFQVFSFGRMVDEFTSKAEAMRLARSIARNQKLDKVNVLGKVSTFKR